MAAERALRYVCSVSDAPDPLESQPRTASLACAYAIALGRARESAALYVVALGTAEPAPLAAAADRAALDAGYVAGLARHLLRQ